MKFHIIISLVILLIFVTIRYILPLLLILIFNINSAEKGLIKNFFLGFSWIEFTSWVLFIILAINIFIIVGNWLNMNSTSTLLVFILTLTFNITILSYDFIVYPILLRLRKTTYIEHPRFQEIILKKFNKNISVRILNYDILNAFATGVLPYDKIILLGKPLLDKMNGQQAEAILYHEYGHLKNNHISKLFLLNIISTTFFTYMMVYHTSSLEFLFTGANKHSLSVCILAGSLSGILSSIVFYVQRNMEYEADEFSRKQIGSEALVSSLITLNELSGGKMEKASSTHPTLKKRIEHITKFDQSEK